MDYKEKYNAALERAKAFELPEYKNIMASVFPELAELEDERIRKALIEYFGEQCDMSDWNGVYGYQVLAWLEKQSKETSMFSNIEDDVRRRNTIQVLEYARSLDTYNQYGKADIDKNIAWLEKLGEQNFDYEHADIPQKDFAPIEPKFKVGDWISGYYTNYKVTAINSKGYVVEDIDGNKINILFENEKLHHLWTIQDAKDGDVLVDVYGNIGIFEQYDDFDWSSYCSLGVNGGFQHFKVEHENEKTYPATKEQYDLLFQKIEEAGYKFDFEKKELKKMEVVSKESKDE